MAKSKTINVKGTAVIMLILIPSNFIELKIWLVQIKNSLNYD